MNSRNRSDDNSQKRLSNTHHEYNLSQINIYPSADLFHDYVKRNCKDVYGKLAIAKESQLKTKINQSNDKYTPYELLNSSMYMFNNKLNKAKLTKSYYSHVIGEYTGFIGIHIYLLYKFKGQYIKNAFKRRKGIVDFILNYIGKYKNSDKNSDHFISQLNKEISKLALPKGILSCEFHDLITALCSLSKEQLVNHFNEYTSWKKNQQAISVSYLQFSIANCLKNSKIINIKSRSGYYERINLAISMENLGLSPGCRLTTRLGNSTIIGLVNDELWIKLDDDAGASYFDTIKTKEDLLTFTNVSDEPELLIPRLTPKLLREQIHLNKIINLKLPLKTDNNIDIDVNISQQALAKFKVNIFDRISISAGKATIVGTHENHLVICYDDQTKLHLFDPSVNDYKIEIIDQDNADYLGKTDIIQMLDLLCSEFAYQFPIFNYCNYNSRLMKNNNIFFDLNYYMGKKSKKISSGRADKDYHERALILEAIFKLIDSTAAMNEDYSKVLKNNLDIIKIPKGYLSKNFYKMVGSLSEMPYKNLVEDYLEYSNLVKQNTDFILYVHHLLFKLFKMLINENKPIFEFNSNESIHLDTSADAFKKFNCNLYDRISTIRGEGIVLGVQNNNLVALIHKRGLTSIKSKKVFKLISKYDPNDIDNSSIANSLPSHITNIFFPSKISGADQNEIFTLCNEILNKHNLQFLSPVSTNYGKGLVLGMWNDKLMVYLMRDDKYNDFELTPFSLNNIANYSLTHRDDKLDDDDMRILIRLLIKLSYKLRSTFLIDSKEKLTFKLDLLESSNTKSNHSTLFSKFKNNKDKFEQVLDQDDNLQSFDEQTSSIYSL